MPGHIARTTGRIAALRTAGWIAAARSTGRIAAVRTAGRSTAARTVGWIAAAAAAAVLGCSGADDTAKVKQNPASEGAVTIGVSLLTRTHPFYQELEEGLKEAAGAAGFQVRITAGEFDVARQKDQLQDFLTQRVDAIIVCPCDSRSIGTAIKAANEAGIPVFTADIACLAEGVAIVTHVASDNVEGGRLAARALAEAIHGAGAVAIIDHPEVESVIQRVKGFEEEIAKYPDITIVAKLSGHGVKDQAFRTAEDILQAHPDLAGFFGINDDSALGALAAIEKAGKLGRVKIVGFDAVPEARQAIEAGKIHADVIQQPRKIGQRTVEAVQTYLSGGAVEPQILIPCDLFAKPAAQ
ncbi:MAG TPA: substrate-binding domain-containing protein [candidate division Zixibacteria bacterium]|nr:substrate-binding domain-containing protein [candidate division Zixibacteria bacterium]MDD4916453.1 substrate-binding domain-containing protein [candidate division Zixibacteria bacterium]MDM7972890.1 substrate-binding domain-containing protein [candidate division Zixibacteria bacterium]HOD65122.1 substrate-binding domain-containing protein [candidate division Zixibacteria bacterium]HOZ07453.1 substrate-binding domain-containing protein [candidate division Zixibacteria bacterium]